MKKPDVRLSSLPRQLRASLWFTVSNVLVKGISFLTLPLFSRLLTTAEYGRVSVYQSWVSVVSIVTTLTIWGGGLHVGMVKYAERRKELLSSFQGLAASLTAAAGILSLLLLPQAERLTGLPAFLILCLFLETAAQIPLNLWAAEQRYDYKYRSLITVTVLMSLLNPLAGLLAVLHSPFRAEARIAASLAVQLLTGAVLFCHIQKKGRRFFDRELWKFGFSFNAVLIPHYLSMQILSQSDRIMIRSLCGESDAGLYSAAYNFAMLLSLVTGGINASLTPHIYQCLQNRRTGKLRGQITAVVLLAAVLSLGLTAVIPDIFRLLLPASYYPALKVVPPAAAGMFFLFLYPLFGSVEFYFEENRYVAAASIGGAALNIGLNLLFIPRYGFAAAAYTTLFCYLCFCVCHYLFMKKVLRRQNLPLQIYDGRAIAAISAAVLLGSLLMAAVYGLPFLRRTLTVFLFLLLIWKRRYFIGLFKSVTEKG